MKYLKTTLASATLDIVEFKTNKMKKGTHKTRCLKYLQDHKSITSLQAIQDLGNTRLAQTILTLKRDGHSIHTETIEVSNRWGGTAHVAKYTLLTNGMKEAVRKIFAYGKGL